MPNPLISKDKAMTSPKMPKKMPAKKMAKVGKAKKHDPMYGC